VAQRILEFYRMHIMQHNAPGMMTCKLSNGFIALEATPVLLTQGSQHKHSRAKLTV